jgi:hypothetical protein
VYLYQLVTAQSYEERRHLLDLNLVVSDDMPIYGLLEANNENTELLEKLLRYDKVKVEDICQPTEYNNHYDSGLA